MGLYDRNYMTDDYQPRRTSALTWVICGIIAGFILQNLFIYGFRTASFNEAFGLSREGLMSGRVWELLTYALLHDTSNFWHILGNLLGLFFLGRELMPYLGAKRFYWLCGCSAIAGGLLWMGVHWNQHETLLGASAVVSSLLVVYASINPNQPITLLLFFVLPVTIKPKYLALGLLAIDLFGFVFFEILGGRGSNIAHSAHLGGMIAGWVYFRYIHQREWRKPDGRTQIELPRWLKRRQKHAKTTTATTYKVNISTPTSTTATTSPADIRAEVDRILDKINSHGFASLTAQEKRVLDEARDLIGRG